MTDLEIRQYLDKNNYRIRSQDCVMDILNTSRQIIDETYNFENQAITIKTPENTFTFHLTLG